MTNNELVRFSISQHLMMFRKVNHLSKTAMAEALGVNPSTYRSWETARSSPKKTMLLKISKLIGISIDELLGETNMDFEARSDDEVYGDKYLSELTNDEKIFIMKYRQLNNNDKKKLDDFIKEINTNK